MEKKDLLDKWLNGELTSEEFEVFRTLPEYSSYQKIDAFVKRIDLPVHDNEAGLREVKSKVLPLHSTVKPKIFSLRSFYKIAAVLTVLLASYYFLYNAETTQSTTVATVENIKLPDQSKVVLNENTELSYKKLKWRNDRRLSLMGEAYFDVEKGSSFTVETAQGEVTVLGTQFNVLSRDGVFEVSCFEGLVNVIQGEMTVALPAGKSVRLVGDNFDLSHIYTSEPNWILNESRFDDVLVENVIAQLEKHFDRNIKTENIDVNLRYTGGFPLDDLESALKAVTIPLNLNYRIDDKDAVIIFGKNISE